MEFLKTGRLGPLHLGMTRQQIIQANGEPDDVGRGRKRDPDKNCILLYGETDKVNLQLALDDGVLSGIWMYFRGSDNTSTLPEWILRSSGLLKGSFLLNDFFAWADEFDVPWRLHYPLCPLCFEDQTTILLPNSNVHLIWGHDPDTFYAAMLTNR